MSASGLSTESSNVSSFATEESQILLRPTAKQKAFEQAKKLAALFGSVPEIAGSMVGGAKLAQLITNTVFSYLPLNSTTSEAADVSYWTMVAVCPFLLYTGMQSARVQYNYYLQSRKDQEREERRELAEEVNLEENDDFDTTIHKKKLKNHAAAAIKSLASSHNVIILYTQIVVPLLDQQTFDFRLMIGLASLSFVTNYYCQLSVFENADLMLKNRLQDEGRARYIGLPVGVKSCWDDFDAKRTGVLDTAISADLLADAVKAYGDIKSRQNFYGFAGEVAAIGSLCLYLATQNKKSVVESRHQGKRTLEKFERYPPFNEERACYANKKLNMITAAAHLRASAIGGTTGDLMMRASQQFSHKMAIPAALAGILIYRLSLDVLKKYYARGYVNRLDAKLSETERAFMKDPLLGPGSPGSHALNDFAEDISNPNLPGVGVVNSNSDTGSVISSSSSFKK